MTGLAAFDSRDDSPLIHAVPRLLLRDYFVKNDSEGEDVDYAVATTHTMARRFAAQSPNESIMTITNDESTTTEATQRRTFRSVLDFLCLCAQDLRRRP